MAGQRAFESRFIEAGMLVEGTDFKAWCRRIETLLIHQDLRHCNYDNTKLRRYFHGEDGENDRRKAADIIRVMVAPTILQRVPRQARATSLTLWDRLEALSKPFPLLDLPEEVRFRIYREIMLDQESGRSIGENEPMPAILQACRQVRSESREIFFSLCTFYISTGTASCGILVDSSLVDSVRRWVRDEVRGCVKALRHVKLYELGGDDDFDINFKLTDNNELAIDYDNEDEVLNVVPDEGSKQVVDTYINELNKNCAGLGLQGELIVLALLSKPELWEGGTLQWRRKEASDDGA